MPEVRETLKQKRGLSSAVTAHFAQTEPDETKAVKTGIHPKTDEPFIGKRLIDRAIPA